jgi:hypothetical protein
MMYRFGPGPFFCIDNVRWLLLLPEILSALEVFESLLGVMDDFLTGHALIVQPCCIYQVIDLLVLTETAHNINPVQVPMLSRHSS